MFPPTRHHNPGWWSREGRAGVHMVATALARLIDAESRRSERREQGWQRRQQRSPSWRREPRPFDAPPPASPPRRTPAHGRWRSYPQGDPRRQTETGSCSTPSSVPGIGEAPCGPGVALPWQQSELPVGAKRSWTRGGLVGLIPEALCGEAPKSLPVIHRRRPSHPRNGQTGKNAEWSERQKARGRQGGLSGQVRTWGPLSRRSAWRAGRFWDDLDGKVKVFLEKDGKEKKSELNSGFKRQNNHFGLWK